MIQAQKSKQEYKYVYGPVHSWRLGVSLGIDPLSQKSKVCNFDCIYCQLGDTPRLEKDRKVFVPTRELINEVKSLPDFEIDYFTFSGRGEPTLAKNLGEMIDALRKIRNEKIAVITNSALMYRQDVRNDLLAADFVLAKLDVCSQETFETIYRTTLDAGFRSIVDSLKDFRALFRGRLALQIMFIEQNKKYAKLIADIAKEIKPDEVELNTPLRPSAVKPLPRDEVGAFKKYFTGLPVVSVYDYAIKDIEPLDRRQMQRRHGGSAN